MAKAIKKTAAGLWWLIGLVLAVVFGAVGRASEAIAAVLYGTPPPPPKMTLRIDQAGNAGLMNHTGTPVAINGYEVWSAGSLLKPTGWRSIRDASVADPYEVIDRLGEPVLWFSEVVARTYCLSEANLSGYATFQPGDLWSIGQPVLPGPVAGDLTFYYVQPSQPGNKFAGIIDIVPEPASTCLLLAGVGAVLASGRKNTAG
jgi:hypothetical protein